MSGPSIFSAFSCSRTCLPWYHRRLLRLQQQVLMLVLVAAVSIDATVTGASFIIGASVAGGLACDEEAETGPGADCSRSEVIGMPIDSRKRARVALASERVEEG
jgi:hypothetical protein